MFGFGVRLRVRDRVADGGREKERGLGVNVRGREAKGEGKHWEALGSTGKHWEALGSTGKGGRAIAIVVPGVNVDLIKCYMCGGGSVKKNMRQMDTVSQAHDGVWYPTGSLPYVYLSLDTTRAHKMKEIQSTGVE